MRLKIKTTAILAILMISTIAIAMPVMAQTENILQTGAFGTAVWSSVKKHSGSYSAYISDGGVGLHDAPFGTEQPYGLGRVVITGVDTLLSGINTLSYYLNYDVPDTTSGPHPDFQAFPYMVLELDADGGSEADLWIVLISTTLDSGGYMPTEGQWEQWTLSEYNNWHDAGPGATGNVGEPTDGDTLAAMQTAYPDAKVLKLKVAVGEWAYGTYDAITGYVDDIEINGHTYDLEPGVVNIDSNEGFDTIQAAIDDPETLAGHTITVAAGTYAENLVIDKSLTVKSIDGAEATTIDAQGEPTGVLINGEDTVVTFEGFTVTNYNILGIQVGLAGPVWQPDPLEVHILNNIVEAPSRGAPHDYNIHFSYGATGTVIGNEVSGAPLLGDPAWANLGIHSYCASDIFISDNYVHDCLAGIWIMGARVYKGRPAAENNIIESNLIENCKTGITVQHNSIGTIIRYNDVLNNDGGIEVKAVDSSSEQASPSGTEIHLNNIVGNELYGVKSFISGSDTGTVLAEEVDAEYNWWGSNKGPIHADNPLGEGDEVTDFVDYVPWLGQASVGITAESDGYDLTVGVDGQGTAVATDPEGDEYFHGEVADLTADAAENWHFKEWTANVANPDSVTTTITMYQDESVTAYFELDIVSISVDPLTVGFGKVIIGTVSSSHQVTITNDGNVKVEVDAEVIPASGFFDTYLRIGGEDVATWSGHTENIIVGGTLPLGLTLDLTLCRTVDTYADTLVFWAEKAP